MLERRDWDFIKAKYLISAVQPEQYPEGDMSEIAFIGRSNVGKSSLINSLCRNKNIAKTSGTPGKTRTINFFEIEAKCIQEELPRKQLFLVDLPGYGFAKVSKDSRKQWAQFIHRYVTNSERLKTLYLLIDIRHSLMANDRESFQWLSGLGLDMRVVFTKADKLSQTAAAAQKKLLCQALNVDANDVIVYSSVKNTGRQKLINDIIDVV